jgi:hypothetical protein
MSVHARTVERLTPGAGRYPPGMRNLGLLAASALLLTGCSGGDGDDKGAPDAEESSTTITSQGFTYAVPGDWAEKQDDNYLSAAAKTGDDDGFADNLNVGNMSDVVMDLSQAEDSAKSELVDLGDTDVTIEERTKVGGIEAAHISANATAQGATYRLDEYLALVDDVGYVVTYNTSPDLSDADRAAVIDPILASFHWK